VILEVVVFKVKILENRKEGHDMKKTIFWGGIVVLILVAFASYGAFQQKPISKDDLPALKGKWVGTRSFAGGSVLNTDLVISNDTLPVEGKLIFYDVQRRGGAASTTRTETIDFKAKINEKGNLYIKGGNVEVELSLLKDGDKMKLEGDFYWTGRKGTMSFKK